MAEATIIGVDPATNPLHLHGAAGDGAVLFHRKLSRPQFLRFMTQHPAAIVAMEARGGAHYRARELAEMGH